MADSSGRSPRRPDRRHWTHQAQGLLTTDLTPHGIDTGETLESIAPVGRRRFRSRRGSGKHLTTKVRAWCRRRFVASCRPGGVAHRLHFAIDVGICDVFGWSSRGQLRDQIFEASVHLGLGKSMGHTGTGRLIEAMDDDEEVFEAEPHVGDGDLRRAKSYVTILHGVSPRRLPLKSLAQPDNGTL